MFAPIQTGSGGQGMMITALAEKFDFYETSLRSTAISISLL
jgi:hypothetical protein